MRTSRSISFSSVRDATHAANRTHFIIRFFQPLHCAPRERIYIYICNESEEPISKFSPRRRTKGERKKKERKKKRARFTSTSWRSTHFDLESISGSTWRGGGSIDRFRMAGSLVGTHHDEIRVEARAILAGRAERSEASSVRLFSASSRARVRLFSRDRHVPPPNASSCLPDDCFRFVDLLSGHILGRSKKWTINSLKQRRNSF